MCTYVIYTLHIYSINSYIARSSLLFHTVAGIPVFWFSATRSVVRRFVPVGKLYVPGLGQIDAEIESKRLDTS